MGAYILRTIDPELWRRVKMRAASDMLPLRTIILELLHRYAEGKIHVVTPAERTRQL